jgi:hypothetical protein
MNKGIAIFLFLLAGTISALAQEPLTSYKARTIAEIATLNKPAVEAAANKTRQSEEDELNGTDPLYSKIELQFLAAARPIAEGRKKLIGNWGKALKIDKKTTDAYVNELKFSEGGKEYWIGIPNSLIPSIAGKIKKGESVSLYVSYAGAFKPKDQKDYESVLIITAVQ